MLLIVILTYESNNYSFDKKVFIKNSKMKIYTTIFTFFQSEQAQDNAI